MSFPEPDVLLFVFLVFLFLSAMFDESDPVYKLGAGIGAGGIGLLFLWEIEEYTGILRLSPTVITIVFWTGLLGGAIGFLTGIAAISRDGLAGTFANSTEQDAGEFSVRDSPPARAALLVISVVFVGLAVYLQLLDGGSAILGLAVVSAITGMLGLILSLWISVSR